MLRELVDPQCVSISSPSASVIADVEGKGRAGMMAALSVNTPSFSMLLVAHCEVTKLELDLQSVGTRRMISAYFDTM